MNPAVAAMVEADGGRDVARERRTAFGCPRDTLDNRFVYTVISPRAGGLSVGVNMNPDGHCNFDCVYCEVDRRPPRDLELDVKAMREELARTLDQVCSGRIGERAGYRSVPRELLELRQVALSGDGEPTLCPNFLEAVQAVIHLRARTRLPFFKLVLITNTTGLDRAEVVEGLKLFTSRDEVWAKLDTGGQDHFRRINRPDCLVEQIFARILLVARQRPVIIQSLFPSLGGEAPHPAEIEAYVQRLRELKEAGAQIPLVQIYSAHRPTPHPECGHLPLRSLSAIARQVREGVGLKAEVY